MYKRLIKLNLAGRESIFLFGPRGTGKTFWLKQKLADCLYFDLLHSADYAEFLAAPSILESRIPNNYDDWIVIDEVQKVPMLLNEVHRLIESKGYRFILTGSSARSLRRKGVNLLAGRALTLAMHPLTAIELGGDFDFIKALEYGMLPAVYRSENPQKYLESYVRTYIQEEVQQEALTRNLALFTKFLTTASFSQGEMLNYTAIGREVGTNRESINNYFNIIEDLLIARRLPVFKRRANRDMVVRPKFYYFDVGVYRILRPKGPLDSEAEISGPALETLFLQQSMALNDYFNLGYTFYYWRTREQLEVDFILYGETGFKAFEIKRKQTLSPKDFKGLITFKADYPESHCYLLYGGSRKYFHHDIEVIPIMDALPQLLEILKR